MSTGKKKNPASKQPTLAPAPTPDPTTDPAPAAPVGEQGSEQGAGVRVLRTDTEKAVWAALGNYPGFTIDEVAGAAGVAGSTARRILTAWETAGVARSHRDPESPRAAKTWTTAEQATTPEPPEPAAPEPAAPEPAAPEPAAPEPVVPEPVAPDTVSAEPTQPASVDGTEPDPGAPADTGQPDTAVAAPTGDEPAAPAADAPAPAPDAAAAQPEPTERLAPGALRGQVEDFLRDHPGEDYTPHQIGKALDRSSGAVHNALVTLTTGGIARQTCAAPKKFALADA